MALRAEECADTRLRSLKDCKSLSAVLDTAMDFEAAACRFYRSLISRLNKEVGLLAEELAQETERQYRHLEEMSRDERLADHLEHCVKRPETCSAFTQYALLPHIDEDALDDDVLEYALSTERLAFEHYGYLFDVTPEGPLKDLFALLAKEKLERIQLLEKRWAVLFSVP
jgi:rubrerythrin